LSIIKLNTKPKKFRITPFSAAPGGGGPHGGHYGGIGLITGRKAFQMPLAEGVEILNAVQDVYRCKEVTIA